MNSRLGFRAIACAMGCVLAIAVAARGQRNAREQLSAEDVRRLLSSEAGDLVQWVSDMQPSNLTGDFNGDGAQDVAIVVKVEEPKGSIKARGIKYFSVDPYSKNNGRELDPATAMGQNCLGLLFLNGAGKGASRQPAGRYLVYDCFSSIKLLRKGARVPVKVKGAAKIPRPAGDSIILDMENGSQTLIYWDGKGYRGFGLTTGD
jgi:hypothetical protein